MFQSLRKFVDGLTRKTPAPGKPTAAAQTAAGARTRATLSLAKPPAPAVPKQSVDPRRFAEIEGAGVWMLTVDAPARACEFALANANQRVAAARAIPLPAPGCCRGDCSCTYKAVADERKGPRRMTAERREQVRFETKKVDRRRAGGRRLEDVWERKRV